MRREAMTINKLCPASWVGSALGMAFLCGSVVMVMPCEGGRGPTDWSAWETYRGSVRHPAGCIKREDIARARQNMTRHAWAQGFVDGQRRRMDRFVEVLTPAYLEQMIEVTSPGCAGACPACIDKGLAWHPTGQWSWSAAHPDQLTCKVCETVFPNDDYPESIAIRSTFDPRQVITYCDGPTYRCHGYEQARPSPSSIIRAKKLNYMGNQLEALGRVYALTGETRYAEAARSILLRLAAVYPTYMVTAGYGYLEYADCDPHLAAENIGNLPTDEICPPPNTPDRSLHTGYWSASRSGSWGHEGGWAMRVAEAYDLTCTAEKDGEPVFSASEKLRIERDLLLESTYLCVCEPRLNNKSIRGRCAAAVIGSIVGHPGLVHWGVSEFCRAVDGDWFLPDGGASECSSYAIVVMQAVRSYMTVFRDYSDPPGYSPAAGDRLDHWNACRDTRFGDCWQALIWSLQGDLTFPPLADTFVGADIPVVLAELLAACYPRPPYPSFLRERLGGDMSSSGWWSLLYRDPDLPQASFTDVVLPDVVFPFMGQGYLRTGPLGRQSLLVLNASHWGGHHHNDSLNLYYWLDGQELLSDLGYLWDHPDKHNLYRTFAHNLVMLDGQEQRRGGRGGEFNLFAVTPSVKIMEASSKAYVDADIYRRTCIQIEHGPGRAYVVDIFRVKGGDTQDYVFHGPGEDAAVSGLSWTATLEPARSGLGPGIASCRNIRTASALDAWHLTWQLAEDRAFTVWSPGGVGETVMMGDGWGQRNAHNKDRGAALPYVIRRRQTSAPVAFVSVFEGHPRGEPYVKGLRYLELPATAPAGAVALAVDTAGGTDIVVSQLGEEHLSLTSAYGVLETDGRVAAAIGNGRVLQRLTLVQGRILRIGDTRIEQSVASWRGTIAGTGRGDGESWFVLEDAPLPADGWSGHTLFVRREDDVRRAYPIRDVRRAAGALRVYTKVNEVGFEAMPADTWEVPFTTFVSVDDGSE